MNTREKILHHLETNKPTSSREFHTLTGAPKSRITQLLRELTESGQLEIYSAHNGIKRYRLTELHANRRKAVLDYLEAGNEGASSAIAAVTGLEVQVTSQILASLCKQGEVHRQWLGREKVWHYSKSAPYIFGMANPLNNLFNQCLAAVRGGRAEV
ncbi:TPA: transcriptional regulator [Citrobacter werkmanii]|uniref:Transcriptional regulator n=1 Tax=Citrobacter werkmanii TaxID=67827 RepID=A0AA37Z986_9ENTR|nr:transcriptional regulator [Citrobacter werkmanii]